MTKRPSKVPTVALEAVAGYRCGSSEWRFKWSDCRSMTSPRPVVPSSACAREQTRSASAATRSIGDVALIRSLVVLPEARKRGIGKAVAGLILEHAGREGARHAYLLTESASDFFEQLGFQKIAKDEAPAAILSTRQAAALCPASAVLLMRDIDE